MGRVGGFPGLPFTSILIFECIILPKNVAFLIKKEIVLLIPEIFLFHFVFIPEN